MARNAKWIDDYWLLLMQIYLQKPVGVKPKYCRSMVDLSLELHIAPQALYKRMCQIARLKVPRIEYIWKTYGNNPQKLARAVSLWREMRGYGHAEEFYDGVEVSETFERDFKPVADNSRITPVMIILILDLYFRLTPITMATETPEVGELAKQIGVSPAEVVEVLETLQYCDPYLKRKGKPDNKLYQACVDVWRRFGNGETAELEDYAAQLKEYFNS